MRAILVSVDYADLLAITLPYNRHHFSEVMVVTSKLDTLTPEVAIANGAGVYSTDSFYDDGAIFNKWKALEEGLDLFGRDGWLCVMDADVLWPKDAVLPEMGCGQLCTPYRRMMLDFSGDVPPENEWLNYRRHKNAGEWAGYSQVFHADDPCLGKPPWHQVNWTHAGGADSFFQRKWLKAKKMRPDFEVLHLGSPATNWCGRVTPYLSGEIPAGAGIRTNHLRQIFRERRRTKRFDHEQT